MPKRTIELLDALTKRGLTNETFRLIHHMSNASTVSMRRYCEGCAAFREGSANELVRQKLEYIMAAVSVEAIGQKLTVGRFREIAGLANQEYSLGCSTAVLADGKSTIQEHLMAKITIPAARVHQGALVLYTTSMRVKDLIAPKFYSIETLDPEDPGDKGFQRLLNQSRAKKLADYIVKGQDTKDAFLPTSVFLATHKDVPFDSAAHTLEIDSASIGPFSVVDGQHRLEGLRMAAMKDERVLDFEVPVNIAVKLPKIHQMCHFLIVNTTQKSVDKSVEQRIVARLTDALNVEDMPSLPKWILNTVERGEVEKAVKYVDYLNSTEDSPWFSKIQMANEDSDTATVNQRSFVKAIVKYVLTANNPLSIVNDFDKEKKIFLNYWKAIHELLDDLPLSQSHPA